MEKLNEIKNIVEKFLNEPTKCYGHCDSMAKLYLIVLENKLLGIYSCENSYISRIIVYDTQTNETFLKNVLNKLGNGAIQIDSKDIRVASRYAWDLGLEIKNMNPIIKETYWTQYFKKVSSSPNRLALFLCKNCGSIFTQEAESKNTLCKNCKK
jgi:hypothetical protein